VFDVMLWLGIIGIALLAVLLRALPKETPKWQYLMTVAGLIAMLAMTFLPEQFGVRVLIIKIPPAGGKADKFRGRMYFGKDYTFEDHHTERLGTSMSGTLVINDTNKELRIESIYYGSISLPRSPDKIAPMTAFPATYGVDHVGPDDHPPEKVSSSISFDI